MKKWLIGAIILLVLSMTEPALAGSVKVTRGNFMASFQYTVFVQKFSKALAKLTEKKPLVYNHQICVVEKWNRVNGKFTEKLIGVALKKEDKVPLWFIKTNDLKKHPNEIQPVAEKLAETTYEFFKKLEKNTAREKIEI